MKFIKDPNNAYRSVPFWSLNGKLDEEELRKQISTLTDMGFGGVFIHSRTGLGTEYMGKEWMKDVSACVDECRKRGVHAWLYDEDRWPSGTCGGIVTEDPRYRARYLKATILPREEFDLHAAGPEFVAAFAVKLEGEPYTIEKESCPAYGGMRIAHFFPVHNVFQIPDGYLGMRVDVELMANSEFYNDFSYVDTMNRAATERFLDTTHVKYAAALGKSFGDTVRGIFTDEPHRGALLSGFGLSNEGALRMLPYTDTLFETYRTRWGEDLREKLPELYFAYAGDEFSRTMWRYVEVTEQLFLSNFARPVHEWCRAYRLALTGHVLHEDTLSAQTTMSGSVMRFYEHMEYPGMDNLGTDNVCFPAAVAVTSVAKQLGKKFVLSELYGCTGWKTTFAEYKRMGDWQALLGVNLRCPHLSWYTMRGEAKRDYPASFSTQATWYREYRAVEDYFARLGFMLSVSKPMTDTLVFTPVESAWGLSHMGTYYNGFSVRSEAYARLEKDFADLTRSLLYAGVDFDYADEEMAGRIARAGKDKQGAYIVVGKMKYRVAVLPSMRTVRSSTLTLLRKFISCGGKVYVLRGLPDHVDGMRASLILEGAMVIDDGISAASVIRAASPKFYAGTGDGDFLSRCKACGVDEYVLFVVNTDYEHAHTYGVTIDGAYHVEKFDLRTGETAGVDGVTQENGKTVISPRVFAPGEEVLWHITRGTVVQPEAASDAACDAVQETEVRYALSRPNMLVLDRAKAFADGKEFGEDEILRLDDRLRDAYGLRRRGGSMVQPWYKEKFYPTAAKPVCAISLEFAFDADVIPKDAYLVTENAEDFTFSLNGHLLGHKSLACDTDACMRCIALPAKTFVTGRNVLRAEGKFGDALNLENMYIAGTFGAVAGSPSRIVALPEKLRFGDVTTQGLPFYSGDITYMLPAPDGEYEIEADDFYAAALKASDGTVCIAPPYRLRANAEGGILPLTCVLTPKNLYGPLHQVPALQSVCGPESFRTSGDAWSDAYALIPQGLFSAPKLRKIK